MLELIFFIISLVFFILIFDKLKNLQWKIEQLESKSQNSTVSSNMLEKIPLKPEAQSQTNTHSLIDNKTKEIHKDSFEKNFAEKIMVWIGSIAIIFSGFYMVKYSIENSLFTPEFRLISSAIFSIILFVLSEFIYKSKIDNRLRISQGLTGAGIAILYACIYAAGNIYEFIPTSISLVFLVLITIFAIYNVNKYGLAIAIIALFGGFLTPVLSHNNQIEMVSLFTYFYIINISISYISKNKGYSGLGLSSTFFSIIISLYFLLNYSTSISVFYSIGIFLIAISYSNALMFASSLSKENSTYTKVSNILTCLAALFIMYNLLGKLEYNLISWSLFWISSLFSLVLLSFNITQYCYLPFASLLISCYTIIKYSQYESSTSLCIILILAFALLYVVGSYIIEQIIKINLIPRILLSTSLISFYLVFSYILNKHQVEYFSIITSLLALTIAAIEFVLIWLAHRARTARDNFKNTLVSIDAFNAGIFCFFGATATLNNDALIIVLTAQIALIAFLNYKYQINSLKSLAILIFIYLCFEYYIELFFLNIDIALFLLTFIKKLHNSISNIKLIELGCSMALLFFASNLLKKSKNFFAGKSLEIFSLFFLISLLFLGINNNFTILDNSSLVARGITDNLLLALALLSVFCGKKFNDPIFIRLGLTLSIIAMIRIISQDLVIYFPAFDSQEVGELFILNQLLMLFGTPIIWLYLISKFSTKDLNVIFKPMQLLLGFCLISFNIRQAYHGSILNEGITSNLEIYTYSIVWIIFGIILAVAGTILKDKYLRHASLAVLFISIGKVFLYDVSELSGLYRVFSFLILGICLIIIGWFYSKYVFKTKQEN